VTNIPGPQFPLYVLGRRLRDLFPLAFLPKNHALAVAIMSYDGGIDYGLLGDYDALPDIDVIADGIDASLRELLKAAARARPTGAPTGSRNGSPGNGAPSPILPTASTRRGRGPAADMRAKRAGRPGSARKSPSD
jgi:hypothetical protein